MKCLEKLGHLDYISGTSTNTDDLQLGALTKIFYRFGTYEQKNL